MRKGGQRGKCAAENGAGDKWGERQIGEQVREAQGDEGGEEKNRWEEK